MGGARRSPPTARVVAVLDRFATSGGRRFGLSELARDLGISKPTCLGILTELTATGYLVRDPRTLAYGLGPALIAAGRAAQRGFAATGAARRHLEPLVARHRTAATVSAVVDDEIMVLDALAAPGLTPARVGERYPFAPPSGLMYVLWDHDEAFERWLAKEPTLPVTLDRGRLRTITARCRASGYLVESLTPAGMRLYSLLNDAAARDLPPEARALMGELLSDLGERVYLEAELSPGVRHPVHLIAAPVYDADGAQELVLALQVGATLTGAEIARRGAALVAAAEAVTAELGGRLPGRADPPIED
ncbi:helix-turn-helix domain-containing protein [Actinocorallia populi]|uniref:helix-turn-helix domain-containing protein n=1 Tax=Actinocorallia populi TaxID=2079200 RepID=UPI000D096789|nr:helix-turn-helix domain-containing protein [Actinocorallia populi]